MADEPLFDPSLKKRKKKTVAFTEDPLGAEADPTVPAPEIIESTTVNGDAVDLGPTTAHEAMKEKKDEEDEFKAMFGDLKKKKKKKDIPLDFVSPPNIACFFHSSRDREMILAHRRQTLVQPPRHPKSQQMILTFPI